MDDFDAEPAADEDFDSLDSGVEEDYDSGLDESDYDEESLDDEGLSENTGIRGDEPVDEDADDDEPAWQDNDDPPQTGKLGGGQ